MLRRINNFIFDKEFRMTIFNDLIHVNNYLRIITIDDNIVSFTSKDRKIVVKGNNFKLEKLVDNEMIVLGKIINIEVIYE